MGILNDYFGIYYQTIKLEIQISSKEFLCPPFLLLLQILKRGLVAGLGKLNIYFDEI